MLEQFLSNAKKSIMEADTAKAEEIAKQALAEGMDLGELLENGYVPGIIEMGDLFEDEKIFLPELMRSAETMKAASEICNAAIKKEDAVKRGKIVLGTVKGDIHDIGKKIVESFLSASGFEVYDLGRDIPAKKFVDMALEIDADVIATSALLTTTMPEQEKLEKELTEASLKDKFKTIVGGAPVNQKWADTIGADAYAEDAASAAKVIRELLSL